MVGRHLNMQPELIFSPTDFVAVTNQVFDQAYQGMVTIEGELSDFKISQNKWVYFNLKDDIASVRFFGTVYMLPGPLEDGMKLKVSGAPRLHPKFGFSITIQTIALSGEGTIKKAFDLLQAKLEAEGLFDPARKRSLPFPPGRIGLITSEQSAAYADFMKILNARFGGVAIRFMDVQVQGEPAVGQIVEAIRYLNEHEPDLDVLVVTRGGGSLDDLAVFSTEAVTRSVATSRIPTLVAVGHEIDVSLAELAADKRASTPSNAAELLVPDRAQELARLRAESRQLNNALIQLTSSIRNNIEKIKLQFEQSMNTLFLDSQARLKEYERLLTALNPRNVLGRGYAIIRQQHRAVGSIAQLQPGAIISIEMKDGTADAQITNDNVIGGDNYDRKATI
ncbi:MAG: exodeoxyribonuclease VII large subunit [Candidatus Saccharibacteria bacterium]|nr:exodeoxyribonuclease VII large subunit [Candidatus Saccharibacteria bacterium]